MLKKAGLDRHPLKNYQPVSSLTHISKHIEKAVAKQINEYFAQEGKSNISLRIEFSLCLKAIAKNTK